MPQINHQQRPAVIWYVTHRCHQQARLLKTRQDRRLWHRWLFEARRRYGLRVLNYVATSNQIHLLVHDQGGEKIARAMTLIANRTAKTFNGRRNRHGLFWEDCYHVTAVGAGVPLRDCLVDIDLNMVRTGQIGHPGDWDTCGYQEIQSLRTGYAVVDMASLMAALGMNDPQALKKAQRHWVEEALGEMGTGRPAIPDNGPTVGPRLFPEPSRTTPAPLFHPRRIEPASTGLCLREDRLSYSVRVAPQAKPPDD